MIPTIVRAASLAVAAAVLCVPGVAPAQAASLSTTSGGYDVSWPQCNKALPPVQAFAIVGVNGGLANNTNPCLSAQLQWAKGSAGTTTQPKVALYVNTANPGLAGSWWPTSNYYPTGSTTAVPNPYGICAGNNDAACAFMYGYAKAYDDATIRGVTGAAGYFWWLDVETGNSWQANKAANRADLEGMTYYFKNVLGAAGVGIYSTSYQWTQIVGSVGTVISGTTTPAPSILNGLPSWLAGATTLKGAQRACTATPLTGGRVTVTQYVSNSLDHDYACP